MCGIVGVLQYPSKISREVRMLALRALFPRMMLNSEIRGDDATGVYQVRADGDWILLKKGQKVSEWVYGKNPSTEDPATFRDSVDWWMDNPSEMTTLIGHCRKATSGSRGGENDDNHPFSVQLDESNAILGVHNGTLSNHERIFEKLKEMGSPLTRQGSVDSESLFHLLYHVSEGGERPWTGNDLRFAAERIEGAYALVASNSRFPHHVAVMKQERSLEAFMIRPLNVVVLSSEKRFVEEALGVYNLIKNFISSELPTLDTFDRMIPEREYRIFDLTKEFPEGGTLAFGDFDKISERGELRKFANSLVISGWEKGSTNHTKSSYSSACASSAAGTSAPALGGSNLPIVHPTVGYPTPGAGVEARASKTPTVPPTIPNTKPESGRVIKAELEQIDQNDVVSEQSAMATLMEAKFLSLSPCYDNEKEVAGALGVTQDSISSLTRPELANRIGSLHFIQGYALGLQDAKKEVENIRQMGKTLTQRLELSAEKKTKAEKKIWEIKMALLASVMLADNGYQINVQHLEKVLASMKRSDLTEQSLKRIVAAFSEVAEDHRAVQERENFKQKLKKPKKTSKEEQA